ncbi:histone H3.v1-like [Anthonomus grandis grandis]|uniref:histone H3.v1-like n=1 Tax=Anthonomus grandis grandis TaxID=2921223 RepID=UPI002165A7AF|nr:histone H3.v1-like [Anthonomus grandis grandis]
MIFHTTLATLLLLPYISTQALQPTNKTKRTTVNDQIYSHGDAKAVLFYMENPRPVELPELQASASNQGIRNFYPAPSKPLALVSVQQPIQVFEQDNPKQVAEQQVLYEFQQTPTNAVSNVHVKQLFQPSNQDMTTPIPNIQGQATDPFPVTQPIASGYISSPSNFQTQQKHFAPQSSLVGINSPNSAATIVSPVHHSVYTNHGLGSAQSFNSYQNPFLTETPQQFQSGTNKAPGKYIYLNGKIVYNPVHIIPQSKLTPNSVYHKGVYHNQQKLPLLSNNLPNNFKLNQAQAQSGLNKDFTVPTSPAQPQFGPNNNNRDFSHRAAVKQPSEKLTPPAYLPPITKQNAGFKAPKKLHPIDKPSQPIKEDVQEEREEEGEQEEEEQPEREEEREEELEDDDEEDAATENEEERESPESYSEEETYGYERFPFDDDDDDDERDHYFKPTKYRKNKHHHHEEDHEHQHEDDHEDQEEHSRHHQPSKRKHRNPPKYDDRDSFGFHEGYSSNSKYKYAKKNGKLTKGDKPSGKFKKVKYSKVGQGKPKVEHIEGKFSENIPVTHKAKIYKERWYVSKDIEGNMGRKPKK